MNATLLTPYGGQQWKSLFGFCLCAGCPHDTRFTVFVFSGCSLVSTTSKIVTESFTNSKSNKHHWSIRNENFIMVMKLRYKHESVDDFIVKAKRSWEEDSADLGYPEEFEDFACLCFFFNYHLVMALIMWCPCKHALADC